MSSEYDRVKDLLGAEHMPATLAALPATFQVGNFQFDEIKSEQGVWFAVERKDDKSIEVRLWTPADAEDTARILVGRYQNRKHIGVWRWVTKHLRSAFGENFDILKLPLKVQHNAYRHYAEALLYDFKEFADLQGNPQPYSPEMAKLMLMADYTLCRAVVEASLMTQHFYEEGRAKNANGSDISSDGIVPQ